MQLLKKNQSHLHIPNLTILSDPFVFFQISYVISISFKINSEKSLGKASSFTQIYGMLKFFPDLTLYMQNIFWANYGSNTLKITTKIAKENVTMNQEKSNNHYNRERTTHFRPIQMVLLQQFKTAVGNLQSLLISTMVLITSFQLIKY